MQVLKIPHHAFALAIIGSLFVPHWALPGLEGADQKKGFASAKKAFQSGMRNKDPADRVAALRKLGEFSTTEAAGLVLKLGLTDPALEVRKAARDVLAGFHENADVGKLLLDQLNLATRKDGMSEMTYSVLWALGNYEFPDLNPKVAKYLDEYLGTPKGNLLILTTLIDDLGNQGDETSMRMVAMLSKARFFETNFGYRRCIVQAVTHIFRPEAVAFLINLLPRTKGLVQHDIVQHLTNLTKQKFRDDNQRWQTWWAANKTTFKFPAQGTLLANEPIDDKQPTYYGIPICAKRVVFALDTSASMRGAPIEAAKRELINVVGQLPPEVYFSIVMFDGKVRVWQPTMVAATPDMKQQAISTVQSQEVRLGTASHAALQASFLLDPEVIYFLSDGAPTDGDPVDIVTDISARNRTRRISVHTIGINTETAGAADLGAFMEALANSDYGNYLAVKDNQRP